MSWFGEANVPLDQRIGVGAVGDPQITCCRGTDIIAVCKLCFVEFDRNIHGKTLSRTQAYKTIGIYSTVPCFRGQPVELEAIIREESVYRSDELRVGKECVRRCRFRWWPYH